MQHYSRNNIFALLLLTIGYSYCRADSLNVLSNPEKADVYINNVLQGKTPITITGMETFKKYTITLKLDGYETYTDSAILKKTRRLNEKKITLTQAKIYALNVSSIPTGAKVYINNVCQGNTPITVEGFEPGKKYKLFILLEDYHSYADSISFDTPGTTYIKMILTKAVDKRSNILAIDEEARYTANTDVNKTLWFVAGLLGGPVGVALAFIMEPSVPVKHLVERPEQEVEYFKNTYKKEAQSIQRKQSSTGCVLFSTCCCLLYFGAPIYFLGGAL